MFGFFRRRVPPPASPLEAAVRDALKDVQAYARSHGGEIELLEVTEEGEVSVRLRGACRTCPIAGLTLRLGVEQELMRRVPGVRKVRAR